MKLIKALVALVIAASAFAAATGPAWAAPCARGEEISGKTATHWMCRNIETGVVRPVLI